jgi:hypothetical protein
LPLLLLLLLFSLGLPWLATGAVALSPALDAPVALEPLAFLAPPRGLELRIWGSWVSKLTLGT